MGRLLRYGALLLWIVAVGLGQAAVHVVDDDNVPCFGAAYRTIQDAVAFAEAGDTIEICPGLYQEQVVLTKPMALRGRPVGSQKVVLRPPALPASRPSLNGNRSVAAGIVVDARQVALSELVVDMTATGAAGCSPLVAGVYLRGASGPVTDVVVVGAGAAAPSSCDTGVGLLAESGQIGEYIGRPLFARALVSVDRCRFSANQKGGIAGVGDRTVARVSDTLVEGNGSGANRVENGIEISRGASARIRGIRVRAFESPQPGIVATGLLFYGAARARLKNSTINGAQVGVFVVGDRTSVLRSQLDAIGSDGLVFFGFKNRAFGNLIAGAGVAGIFVDGDQTRVRRGLVSDSPVGVWVAEGDGNSVRGVEYRGVAQRERWNVPRAMDPTAVDPLTLDECAVDSDCDDGNPCTAEVCDLGGGGVCAGSALPDGTPCVDGNLCNGDETCGGGACLPGVPLICLDGNECTADICDFVLGCQFPALPDGTPCTGGTCQSVPDPVCVP